LFVVITMSSQNGKAEKAGKPVNPIINVYLTLFNLLSAAGWAYVFYISMNVLIAAAVANGDYSKVFTNATAGKLWVQVEKPLKIVQTMALLEILHSILKFTNNNAFTVAMQVTSRIWVLWFSMDVATNAQSSIWFILACVSWSLVEVPKYLYHPFKNIELLKAYRYNAFYVLYPTGYLLMKIAINLLLTRIFMYSFTPYLFIITGISGEVGCMYESFTYLKKNMDWTFYYLLFGNGVSQISVIEKCGLPFKNKEVNIPSMIECITNEFVKNIMAKNQSKIIPLFNDIAAGVTIPANILLYLTIIVAIVYAPGSPFMYINMMSMKKKAYSDEKKVKAA